MIAEPVELSPTKPIALMAGCSVRALPASSPKPCTVEHAVGNTGFLDEPCQNRGRHRRPLGRLVHDGAARGQRRSDLPGREHERRVPRRDHADRTDRHAGRDIPVLVARRVLAIARLGALVGEEAKILGGADRGLGHEAMGLAGVDAFEHGDVVGIVLDRVGDAVQQLLPHRRSHVAPGLKGEGGRSGCGVDVLGVAARDARKRGAIDRRFRFKGFARDRGDGLAVDHVADAVGLQLLQQRCDAVTIGLEHIGFRRGLIHGQPPLSGRRGCCCASSSCPCR
ncbi:hypothetical protein ABIF69_002287 [Bradyrhizobium japonicum]